MFCAKVNEDETYGYIFIALSELSDKEEIDYRRYYFSDKREEVIDFYDYLKEMVESEDECREYLKKQKNLMELSDREIRLLAENRVKEGISDDDYEFLVYNCEFTELDSCIRLPGIQAETNATKEFIDAEYKEALYIQFKRILNPLKQDVQKQNEESENRRIAAEQSREAKKRKASRILKTTVPILIVLLILPIVLYEIYAASWASYVKNTISNKIDDRISNTYDIERVRYYSGDFGVFSVFDIDIYSDSKSDKKGSSGIEFFFDGIYMPKIISGKDYDRTYTITTYKNESGEVIDVINGTEYNKGYVSRLFFFPYLSVRNLIIFLIYAVAIFLIYRKIKKHYLKVLHQRPPSYDK